MDLHYDELLADPRACLSRVHAFMGACQELPAAYWELVDSLTLRPAAADWLARMPTEDRIRIETVQRDTLDRWCFSEFDACPALPASPDTGVGR
jgi:hypothetical protein